MTIILNLLFAILGFILAIYAVAQILTIFIFAIPFTNEVRLVTDVQYGSILKKCLLTVLIWLAITLSITWLVYSFTSYIIGFLVGFAIGFLLTIPHCGRTDSNFEEYFSTYSRYMDTSFLNNFNQFCSQSEGAQGITLASQKSPELLQKEQDLVDLTDSIALHDKTFLNAQRDLKESISINEALEMLNDNIITKEQFTEFEGNVAGLEAIVFCYQETNQALQEYKARLMSEIANLKA